MDDGRIRATSHTRLRFRYDFEAGDGTTIRVRIKANLHYTQIRDGDEGSQSIRLRAKAVVSILQENVSSGLTPLLETPDVSAEAKEGISQAVGLFNQVADTAVALFLESDPLDGDALIAGLVDAFNGLSESIASLFNSGSAEDPKAVSSGEAAELLGQVAAHPGELLAAETDQIEAVPPANVDSGPPPEEPSQDTVSSTDPENGLVESVEEGQPPASQKEVLPEADEQQGPNQAQEVQRPTNEQPRPSVGSVMFKLRFRVIQSLTSLIGVFDPESPSVLASQSVFRASAQLAARYEFGELAGGDSTSHDDGIDTRV
jgi:hypothetical protein